QLMQTVLAQVKGQTATPLLQAGAPQPASAASTGLSTVRRATGSLRPSLAAATQQQEFKRFGPYKPIEKGEKGGLTNRQQKALDELIGRYIRRTAASRKYTQEHRAHFADPRAVSGFKQNWKEMVYPIVSARS